MASKTVDQIIEQLKDAADYWRGADGTTDGQMVVVSRNWLRRTAYELDQAARLERCRSTEIMGKAKHLLERR